MVFKMFMLLFHPIYIIVKIGNRKFQISWQKNVTDNQNAASYQALSRFWPPFWRVGKA